jgi:hypothetical protein
MQADEGIAERGACRERAIHLTEIKWAAVLRAKNAKRKALVAGVFPSGCRMAHMNLRHAAALALVAWYLMVPPVGKPDA